MKHIYLTLALACASVPAFAATESLKSPDGRIEIRFSNDGEYPVYEVSVDGGQLIAPSRLGLDAAGWNYAVKGELSTTRNSHNETWHQPWGENKTCVDNYNEMAVTLPDGS